MQLGESRFWQSLWEYYSRAPSIAICRVPELEYASILDVQGNFLDHCCGNGLFASLAWSRKIISAGCDISRSAIDSARKLEIYQRLDVCDASKTLPYDAGTYNLIFNNSALEHIKNLDDALREVARVLKVGGEFAFNVLNHRYFEWWPLDKGSKLSYREWQPFYHALSISEWSDRLEKAGLKVTTFKGYFDPLVSRRFAKLDYWFSGFYIRNLPFTYAKNYLKLKPLMMLVLKKQFRNLVWETDPDGGAGYFIRAVKRS